MKMEIQKMGNFDFLIRYPQGYQQGKRYPVILMLHGAGGRGNDMEMIIRDNPYFKITQEQYPDFPFITVAPQCNQNNWFDHFESLRMLVRWVYENPFTEQDRIYGMGVSMGGYGIWQLAMSMPKFFAAIVPICGGGMYWNAARLVNVPVWAHHGEIDHVVKVEESIKMVEAVKKQGGEAMLTVYPDTDHNSWTPTFSNPEVFEWLLSKTNQNSKELKEAYIGQEMFG